MANQALPASRQGSLTERFALPSWALSVAFHMLLAVVLGLLLQFTPEGSADEPLRDVGITLAKTNEEGREFYEDGGGQSDAAQTDAAADQATQDPLAESLSQEQAMANNPLPTTSQPIIGPGGNTGGGGSPVQGMTQGRGPNKGVGGGGKTKVFGVEGSGSSFIYVFDRSASMGGSGRNALAAAKAELLGSLQSLTQTQQFQIIFYNQEPWIFNPRGRGRLAFANEQAKENAIRFVNGVTADGNTDHVKALKRALALSPDVIFFLTDAEEPQLNANEMEQIRRLNNGTSINVIEFGRGPLGTGYKTLRELAGQNGGKYGYVNILDLPSR